MQGELLLSQTVGGIEITLTSEWLDVPKDDPGYDFLFGEVFVVETHDAIVGIKATYGDYETARNRYDSEVSYYATSVAKKALRLLR